MTQTIAWLKAICVNRSAKVPHFYVTEELMKAFRRIFLQRARQRLLSRTAVGLICTLFLTEAPAAGIQNERKNDLKPASVNSTGRFVSSSGKPRLIAPKSITIGESPGIHAADLTPGNVYQIVAEMRDVIGRNWRSSADFRAGANGVIDLEDDPPIQGSYNGRDMFGLLWSMKMLPQPDGSKPLDPPLDYNEITYQLSANKQLVSSTSTKQWIIPPGLKSERTADGIIGEIFSTADSSGSRPGILLLGGSGGGMNWARRQAALLANEGYVAMALAYFNAEGLEKHLAQIPLEYVDKALNILINHRGTDRKRIAIMGYSKGAELALLMGSRRNDVSTIVAYAPASAVFQGFKPPKYPVISSWSFGGEDWPFVPNAYDKQFFETNDGMYLWYRTLKQYDKMEAAAIPIEKVSGRIMLISGAKDTIWPSTLMGEQMVGRLRILGLKAKLTHLVFGDAGHGIAAPPGEPLTRVAKSLGGTPHGNATARREGWRQIKEFLSKELGKT